MRSRLLARLVASALIAMTLAPARAQETPPAPREIGEAETVVLEGDAAFAVALRLLIAAREYDQALQLLDARPDLADRADVKRLRAQLLIETGRDREAIALLEAHLTATPDDALARFQLAEFHFSRERDRAAQLAYRLAAAGELDPVRARIVQARLAQIRARRDWRFWAGLSVTPDSNLNAATDASSVALYDLPFELDDEARRQSGVSLGMFGGVERRIALGELMVRGALFGSVRETTDENFDAQFLSMRVGPELALGEGADLTVQLAASYAWRGGEPLETSTGIALQLELEPSSVARWAMLARADWVDALLNESRDGWLYGADVIRTRFLGPSSLWRVGAGTLQRDAAAGPEGFLEGHASIGALAPLPYSVLVYVEIDAAHRDYAAAAAAFGERREDVEVTLTARFSKRDWVMFGAFPFVEFSTGRNESNISLYEFERERLEFGFTREF